MDSAQSFAQQLSKMSIFFQIAVVAVILVFFLVGWLIIKRPSLKDWTIAWFFDIIALIFVLLASLPGVPFRRMAVYYYLYSIFKLIFIYFLIQGIYRLTQPLTQPFDINKTLKYYRFFLIGAALLFLYTTYSMEMVHLQALVDFAIGIATITVGANYLRRGPGKDPIVVTLSFTFIVYGTVFIHHGVLILPVFWRKSIPAYMSHISFIDAIVELSLGIALFLVTQISALKEIKSTNQQLEESRNKLSMLVDIDPLTGVYNRRKLRAYVDSIDEGFLVFVDIDKFKSINDKWGHQMGDKCLIYLANMLKKIFRNKDGLFRYGGDEFLLILPNIEKTVLLSRIKQLKQSLRNPPYWCIPISISVGFSPFGKKISFSQALKMADKMMYSEKK